MPIIPHPPIQLSEIRVVDIWFLLCLGAVWEIFCRLILLIIKRKPKALVEKEAQLRVLQAETAYKRRQGPAAFVETSKLERQVLALEKELQTIYGQRKQNAQAAEKTLLRNGNMLLSCIIFVLYYGVPMITVQAPEPVDTIVSAEDETAAATAFMKAVMFPISYVGMGVKVSKWGMGDKAGTCVGALVVMWSSQVTVGKLFDAVEAYLL